MPNLEAVDTCTWSVRGMTMNPQVYLYIQMGGGTVSVNVSPVALIQNYTLNLALKDQHGEELKTSQAVDRHFYQAIREIRYVLSQMLMNPYLETHHFGGIVKYVESKAG